MMNRNIISLAILLLVLGMISTVGSYFVQEAGAKEWFYSLAVIGQGVGTLVVYLENREAKMWERES